MQETFECDICGEETAEDHDHSGDVVWSGDGWFGQYLTPACVLDVEAEWPGSFDRPTLDAARRWYEEMYPETIPHTTSPQRPLFDWEYELVLYASTYEAEAILADHGMTIVWDDGFVVYEVGGGMS